MPGEIDLPIPDPASLTRGRFTYFPVVPGRLEFAIEVRRRHSRKRPQVVAVELPGHAATGLDQGRRPPPGDVSHLLPG